MRCDLAKIYRIQYYLVTQAQLRSDDLGDACDIIEGAYRDADAANYHAARDQKERNAFRRAARKAGEACALKVRDCQLAFIVEGGWFPAEQKDAIRHAIAAARNDLSQYCICN